MQSLNYVNVEYAKDYQTSPNGEKSNEGDEHIGDDDKTSQNEPEDVTDINNEEE